MNCPICGHQLEYDADYLDFILMEYEYKCISCQRYAEHFFTGSHRIDIKIGADWGECWGWSYNSPLPADEEQDKNDAIARARAELVKMGFFAGHGI